VNVPVLGRVDVRELGRTLTHEHVSASIAQNPDVFYREPPKEIADLPNFDDSVINLGNNGLVRQYPSVYNSAFIFLMSQKIFFVTTSPSALFGILDFDVIF